MNSPSLDERMGSLALDSTKKPTLSELLQDPIRPRQGGRDVVVEEGRKREVLHNSAWQRLATSSVQAKESAVVHMKMDVPINVGNEKQGERG